MSEFFAQPGLWIAWGLQNGTWDAVTLAARARASGFKWIAQEVNGGLTDAQVASLRLACHNAGLYYGIWEVSPRSLDTLARLRPNFWILNVESDRWPGYDKLLADFRLKHPLLPAGVATNGDLDAAPFLKRNVKALPEAYQGDNPQATPVGMTFTMKQLGYRHVFPVLGCYGGYPLASYSRFGDGYSVYLAEGMTAADWAQAATWNGVSA